MEAKERLYETIDGQIVREGDPRGAFLKFAIGDQVGTDYEASVSKLTKDDGVSSMAYHDDDARDVLRMRQANPTRETKAIASAQLTGDDEGLTPVFIHDRLATELADEARTRANRNELITGGKDDNVTSERLYRTEDGELVREGDVNARTLAYGPGDKVKNGDLDSFRKVRKDADNKTPSDEAAEGGSGGNATDEDKVDGRTRAARQSKMVDASPNK